MLGPKKPKRISEFAKRFPLAEFIGSRSGLFGIVAALTLMMLAGMLAVALDYSRIRNARSAMQDGLDVAVLAAVQEKTQEAAQQTLDRYIQDFSQRESGVLSMNAAIVSFDGLELVATANAHVPMTFARVFSVNEVPTSVHSSAARAEGYQELFFALDLSGSLGMGATAADRARLEQLTAAYMPTSHYGNALPQGCAFACHRREGWEPDNKTVYQIAREEGVKLREDELIHQFGGLVDLLLDPSERSVREGKIKVSVLAFSNWAQELIHGSSSASAVKHVLDDFPTSSRWETDYWRVFQTFDLALGAQGNGTEAAPRKMLIMITDGIESRDAFHAQRAIDTGLCTAIKEKGFDLAIVELKYPSLENNFLYRDTVQPVEGSISPSMEACASPGWYFQALDNDEVPVKFRELKERFGVNMVRLTN